MVVDTSAILCVLLGEREARLYAEAMQRAPVLRIAAPTWLETAMVLTARKGEPGFRLFTQLLAALGAEVVSFDDSLAREALAGWLRFGKGRHPAALNMGDCYSYALARQFNDPLLFKGDDFAKTDVIPAIVSS